MRFQDYEGKINRKAIFLDIYQVQANFLSKKFVYSDINIYLCKRKIKQRRQKGYGIPTTRQAVGILYLLSPQEILI